MIVQGHGVGDDLKAVVQGAVVLAIDALRTVVNQGHQGLGGADALAAFVDFQLHAEVAGTGAIEDGLGLVVIALDAAGDGIAVVACVTQWFILFLVSSLIVGVRQGDQSAAMVAAGIVVVIAGLAKGGFPWFRRCRPAKDGCRSGYSRQFPHPDSLGRGSGRRSRRQSDSGTACPQASQRVRLGFISSGSFPNRKPRKGIWLAFAGLFVMKIQGASLEIFVIIIYSSAVSRVQMEGYALKRHLWEIDGYFF